MLLTLLYILGLQSCPMSIAARESEIHSAIDRLSPSPAQQTYSVWNQRISGRFFLILGYVLFTGLCYVPVFFCIDSLLASEDMLHRKLLVTFETVNC